MNELIIKMLQLFDAFDFDHYVITKQYKKIFKEVEKVIKKGDYT